MMDKMMNTMIRQMSVEEREKMMLQMMPEMMKRVDIKIMAPNMLARIAKSISLYGVFGLITKFKNDAELVESVKERLNSLKESMGAKMPYMMGFMMPLMQNIMPKMMEFMMPMMAGIRQEMKKDGKCIMIDIVEENEELKNCMGDMMFDMCPQMAGKVIPKEKGAEFIENMTEAVFSEN